MSSPDCPHGVGGVEAGCSLCLERQVRAALRTRQIRGVVSVEARLDSSCPSCGGFIQQGEQIFKTPKDTVFQCEPCAVYDVSRLVRQV